jgi:hypothetical protein
MVHSLALKVHSEQTRYVSHAGVLLMWRMLLNIV